MLTACALGAVGAGVAAWPLVDSLNPSAGEQAGAALEVDLAPIAEGQEVTLMWRGRPVFIRHRTKADIEAARAVEVASLPDPQPDAARVKSGHEQWLVQVGVCTHLGCVPVGGGAGEFGGWLCPCHGSHYDTAGRIRKGPAPRNLVVPEYRFLSDTRLRIG